MSNKTNLLPFLNMAYLLMLYDTIHHPNWWMITLSVVLFPFWKSLRDWYDVQLEWKKSGKKKEVEQIEIDIQNEQYNTK